MLLILSTKNIVGISETYYILLRSNWAYHEHVKTSTFWLANDSALLFILHA